MSTFREHNYSETLYREEDYPFIEACWATFLSFVQSKTSTVLPPATFATVVAPDGSCNEVTVQWSHNNSRLLVVLGKVTTVVHDQESLNFKAALSDTITKIQADLNRSLGVDPDIAGMLLTVANCLTDTGYSGMSCGASEYPIPPLLFNKRDSLVGAVSILEHTPKPRVKRTNSSH